MTPPRTHRSHRLRWTVHLLPTLLAVAACQAPTMPPGPTGSVAPTPRPTPTAVPTPAVTPGPSPTLGSREPADLVVRVTRCTEICEPSPGTTVLADGRMIWAGPDGRTLVAPLTTAALREVTDRVASEAALASDGEYLAQLKPGAQPFPRGTSLFTFEVGALDRRIVTAGDPADYAGEPNLWVIPPQMGRLAGLAEQLLEPLAWLGPDAVAAPPQPYAPERFVVTIELFPGIGEMPEFPIDLDDLASPFGGPLDTIGQPVPQEDPSFPVRCLVTTADAAQRLHAAEAAAGARRDLGAWSSAIGYGWARGQGFAQVRVAQALPFQLDPCSDLAAG